MRIEAVPTGENGNKENRAESNNEQRQREGTSNRGQLVRTVHDGTTKRYSGLQLLFIFRGSRSDTQSAGTRAGLQHLALRMSMRIVATC